jgi:hypothetical protein
MNNENEIVAEQHEEVVDYKAKYEEAKKSIDALVSKKDQLLHETKLAKEEREKQISIANEAKKNQLKVAEKNGEFEKLWKAAEEEKESYRNELSNFQKEMRQASLDVKAERIALELSNKDPNKAELLKAFVANSLSKLADDKGNIDDDVLLSIKRQFETDKKYSLLLGGNLSVGGGAPGSTRSAQNDVKSISRQEFNGLDHKTRKSFFTKGGKIVD